MPIVTANNLQAATGCSPALAATYAEHIAEACRLFQIDTPRRVAAFVAQIAHESAGFTATEERLSYSAERLQQLGRANGPGSRWAAAAAQADRLARNPQRLANFVYANRMGNGDEASGDGWKYRGRGLKQLTGKANYEAIGDTVREKVPAAPSFVAYPDTVKDPRWAALSAGAFWHDNELNELADLEKFREITKRVNGGLIGYDDRVAVYRRARRAFGVV